MSQISTAPGTGSPLDSVRPELLVVFMVFVATGVLHQLGMYQTVVLNAFYLPVVLAGYYFGRMRAVTTAIAAIALVYWFALSIPGAFEQSARVAEQKWLDLLIWSGLLFAIAQALGHLYDTKRRAFDDLQQAYNGMLEILSKFIDTADRYTEAHSVRVSIYAVAIAEGLDLPEHDVEDVRVAALLHDVGKLDVSVDVLRKVGSLSEEEWETMKQHPDLGANLVGRVGGMLKHVVPLILHHHERFDGGGYHALAGEDIPLGARIIAVADAYDAMTTDRSYRKAMDSGEALERIHRGAGSQFDPQVAGAFIRLMREDNSPLRLVHHRAGSWEEPAASDPRQSAERHRIRREPASGAA